MNEQQRLEQENIKLRELLYETLQNSIQGAGFWLNSQERYVPKHLRYYISIYRCIDNGLKAIAEWKERT